MNARIAWLLVAVLGAVVLGLGASVYRLGQQVNALREEARPPDLTQRVLTLEGASAAAANVAGQTDQRLKRIETWGPSVDKAFQQVKDALTASSQRGPVSQSGSTTPFLDAYAAQQAALANLNPAAPYSQGSLRCTSVQPGGSCLQWTFVP